MSDIYKTHAGLTILGVDKEQLNLRLRTLDSFLAESKVAAVHFELLHLKFDCQLTLLLLDWIESYDKSK